MATQFFDFPSNSLKYNIFSIILHNSTGYLSLMSHVLAFIYFIKRSRQCFSNPRCCAHLENITLIERQIEMDHKCQKWKHAVRLSDEQFENLQTYCLTRIFNSKKREKIQARRKETANLSSAEEKTQLIQYGRQAEVVSANRKQSAIDFLIFYNILEKMSLRSKAIPVFEDQNDIFGIVFNFRKIEKAKRRRLLRRIKLLKLLRKRNLKPASKEPEKEVVKDIYQQEQQFLWDVLERDCLDFKLDGYELNDQESLSFQINKVSQTTRQFIKQEPKKSLFINLFSQFQYEAI